MSKVVDPQRTPYKKPATDPNSVWGTNPYPGRSVIRELYLQEGDGAVDWIDGNRSRLLSAYVDVFGYIHPASTDERRREWALRRFDDVREETRRRLFGDAVNTEQEIQL